MRTSHKLMHFLYQLVMAFGLTVLIFLLLTLAIEAVSLVYSQNWNIEFASSFGYLYIMSFYYVLTYHPLTQKAKEAQTDVEIFDFDTLEEEIEQVYLLASLLNCPMIAVSSAESVNTYLGSYLQDDKFFEDMDTPRLLAMLRELLCTNRLSVNNKILLTRRIDSLMDELLKLNDVKKLSRF